MKVTLTVTKGPQKGRVMTFEEPRGFVLGRAQDADFRLPNDDLYVSRHHVYLEVAPPSCRLRDLGSTNPPHVNGELVNACELADGDLIELGYTQFKVGIMAVPTFTTHPCRGCGKPIAVLPDEPVPTYCPACAPTEGRTERDITARAQCFRCGADLSALANRDGRAAELQGIVLYACNRCLPEGDETAGMRIADYEVCRRLGEGGMGVVYLGYHRATARLIALKQMTDLKDPLLVRRFDREMQLLKSLKHNNILRCIDTGIDAKGAPYIVTEYVTGGSLDAPVRQKGPLPPELAVELIVRVLDGLAYIHGQSVIHRDIKPANILLRHANSHGDLHCAVPVFADFGLAVSYARAGGMRLTKKGQGMGTLMFMPPEQVRDVACVQETADIYALGVTLYYLLTGKYSFDFPSPAEQAELMRQQQEKLKRPEAQLAALKLLQVIKHPFPVILTEEPIPIRQRDPAVPAALAAVVDQAVRKAPRERFQSAAAFRVALDRAR